MKKTFTLVMLALFCICGYAQTIDPVLLNEMGQRTDDEKIKVIVIMKSQYDRQQLGRSAAHYTTRAERREFVVNELKQFAETTQHELRVTLSEMERQDMATAPKIIYMANALYFSATKQAINDLAMRRDIELIGLDEKKHVLFDEEMKPANMTREITSNVTQVNADQVWNLGYTGQGVVVAVIDTGVNYNHLDLADHLWDGGSEYPYHGYNFAYATNDPMDDHGHGTHCAGTVCGDGTAGQQTGIAPDATLMCVKVLDAYGYGEASVTCNAMQWAVEQGCDLFSMSLGWEYPTLTERMLFRNTCAAILDAGVIGAIAAGNSGDWNEILYNVGAPGSCPPPYMDPVQQNNQGGLSCAVCVGAVDVNDNAAYFTSRGPVAWDDTEYGDYPYTEGSSTEFGLIRPDVCAPGVDIVSADSWNSAGYTTMSGTSMATPCVAGCISLMLSKNINVTPAEICQILEETAVPLEEGKSNTFGYGRVDALAASSSIYSGPLTLETFAVNDDYDYWDGNYYWYGNNDGNLNPGESVTLDLTLTNNSDMMLDGATLVLSSASEYVTIMDEMAELPHFDAGQTQTIENVFGFTLSYEAQGNSPILLTAEVIVDGESIGSFAIRIMVYGYVMRFDEVTVLNDDNGNGILEAGETADLHVVISNVGNEPATHIQGYLYTWFPYLTYNNYDGGFFGDIEVNGQTSADFNVTLSYDAPERYIIDFELWCGYNNILNFELVNGYIVFADPQVKAICVSLADIDYDGELTYEEAASVTDLYGSFQYNSSITSFDELQYFTGLDSIHSYAFAYCSRLASIVLPDSITSIGEGAFEGCEHLRCSLTIPNTVTTIGGMAFAGCWSLTGSLIIPNSVTSIGYGAFAYCSGFTGNLTIPNSVISIGSSAFNGCSGFSGSLTIGDSVTSIANGTFYNCTGFSGWLTIGNSVTSIGENAFHFCEGLSGPLNIPSSVTSIGENAFAFCNGFSGPLNIPSSVTSISRNAFQSCKGFTSINCHAETPPSLGEWAFRYWSSNTVVNVPCGSEDAYSSISWGEFNNFYGLCGGVVTVVADPEEGGMVSGGGTIEANQTCTVTATALEGYAFATWTLNGLVVSNSAEYTFSVAGDMILVAHFVPTCNIDFVDSNVKAICVSHWDASGDGELSYAEAALITDLKSYFRNNSTITSFDELQYFIGLTSIRSYSDFSDCSRLRSIGLPKSIVSIYGHAFSGCHNLCFITSLAETPPTIASSTYLYGPSSTIVVFVPCGSEDAYASISWGRFNNFYGMCGGTVTVTVDPEEGGMVSGGGTFEAGQTCTVMATALEGYAFATWTLNGNVVSNRADFTFHVGGDMALVAHFVPEGNINFVDSKVKSICVSYWDTNGDSELSYAEAASITDFKAFFLYSGITSFDELQYFIGLTSIGDTGLEGNPGLISVILPNSLTSIGRGAFNNCNSLASFNSPNPVYIPNSITSIGDWAFSHCRSLTGSLIIPNSVTTIGDYAFNSCRGFTSLTIGNSVTSIGEKAFTGCTSMTGTLTIPNSVNSIGEGAFNSCDSFDQIVVNGENAVYDSRNDCNAIIKTSTNELVGGCKNTVIPNSVTSIGSYAFFGRSSLTSITIPNSVTSIGNYAFAHCGGLSSMTVLAQTPPTLGDSYVFYNVDKSIPVYIPCGTMSAYSEASGWNQFTNYQEILPYGLSVSSSNTEMGTASIVQEPDCGVDAIVQAVPIGNYHFFNWTENGEIVSTEATYSFTLESGRNLVANFGEITNHWTPNVEDYEDNMTFTCVVEIDGEEQRSTMLEVGAFCGEECRGSQRATYFAPTDRYIIQMTVFGEGNDVISFRLYDHQQQAELPLNPPAGVAFSNNGYGSLSNPYILNFTSSVTHTQPLNNGWNWWSTYVELNNNDGLSQLENSIGSNGLVIKSRTNGYVEAYDDNGVTIWYGTLNSINNEQMYKIRTNAACEATVVGVPAVPENHPISINSGWNWIGFPCNQDVSVDVAMSDFTPENNDVIKGRTGFTTYYSDNNYNMWYGTLNTLEVGKGYMYRSNSTTQKTLVFQTGRGETTMENVTTEDNIFQPADGDFADNMTITAVLELDGEELRSEEYELAAFVGDECRGSVKLMYVEPVNRYVAFLTVFGEPSETLYFRLTDGTQTELSMDEITFAADGMEGTLSEPMTLRFGTTKLDENEWSKVLVYPNPSNGVFNIQGQGIRKIEVFNAFGQAVVSEETGNDHLQIDLSRYADGCYMLRVVTDNGISNRQLIKR